MSTPRKQVLFHGGSPVKPIIPALVFGVLFFASRAVVAQPSLTEDLFDKQIKAQREKIDRLEKELMELRAKRDPKAEETRLRLEAEKMRLSLIEQEKLLRAMDRASRIIDFEISQLNAFHGLPRATYAAGRIEKVDAKDQSHAELWYQTDAHLVPGDELAVFRDDAQRQQIGSLEIVSAPVHGRAIGKFTPLNPRYQMNAGDYVASHVAALPKPGAKFAPSTPPLDQLGVGEIDRVIGDEFVMISFLKQTKVAAEEIFDVYHFVLQKQHIGTVRIIGVADGKGIGEFTPALGKTKAQRGDRVMIRLKDEAKNR